jgi:hypothetical protein
MFELDDFLVVDIFCDIEGSIFVEVVLLDRSKYVNDGRACEV